MDDKIEELDKKIEALPDTPPVIIQAPARAHLIASLIQLAFVIIALVGVVGLVLRVEDYRKAQCGFVNQTRNEIVIVLKESAKRPNIPPEQKTKLEEQSGRFQPINCEDPTRTMPLPPPAP